MSNNIFQSEIVNLKNLSNLFIELTAKNCNQYCRNCYIDFPKYKKVEDFISLDVVKQAINDTTQEDIKCIYLTGAEPMTHPEFNSILRFCLGRSSVCICTNGSFINEKKARFLKKVEDESNNEIIFKLSLDHYDEIKNDDVRYRGAYRHSIFAIKHLLKYNFNPIIVVTNYYNISDKELVSGFMAVFKRNGFDLDESNLQINPYYDKNSSSQINTVQEKGGFDCEYGRVITANGVYTCPFLANDYRGRCGSSFIDYSKKSSLETSFCEVCMNAKKQIFSIDFSKFV